MKINVKKMLKDSADKEEISELQSFILKSVDTSKVLQKEFVAPKRRVHVLPFVFGGLAAASLCIGIGLSIGFANSRPANNPINDNPGNNQEAPNDNPVAPTNNPTNTDATPADTPINTDNESPIYYHIDVRDVLDSDLKVMYDSIIKQNLYDIVNAANTFNNVKFNPLEREYSGDLNTAFEQVIASDVNIYLYNIENMLGLEQSLATVDVDNKDSEFNYETVLTVASSHYEYKMYFNEQIVEEKTATRYKYKGYLDGVVVIGDANYAISGTKRIKNDAIEFDIKVQISDSKYVDIHEKFTTSVNDYKFTYHYDNDYKQVIIKQKLEDSKTKELKGEIREKNALDETNAKSISSFEFVASTNETNYIECKLKDFNKDVLSINKLGNSYIFSFKNSGNAYSSDQLNA